MFIHRIFRGLRGDKGIWAFVTLLALFSFMPVFSASANLVYVVGTVNSTYEFLLKHISHLMIGFFIMYVIHKFSYQNLRWISILLLPVVGILLLFTLLKGNTIGGANASRWISVGGFGFQPSAMAVVVLNIYAAQYLAKFKDKPYDFKDSIYKLWIPVGIICVLILPANFSTAALVFFMVIMLVYLAGYPMRYLFTLMVPVVVTLVLFFAIATYFPSKYFSRVNTWKSRIERFTSKDDADVDNYQTDNAKIAIATGKFTGLGPGKSVQRNFLPQSSSDFIFAIIIEEYGLLGGFSVLFIYLMLFFRFFVKAVKIEDHFGKYLMIGIGFPIIIQALVNMGVAVELLPTTGQTLPLISSGGTSIWITCASLGIVLSVSAGDDKTNLKKAPRSRKAKIQDLQSSSVIEELGDYENENKLEQDTNTPNPMDAVQNK